jgi:hypothetical protein
VVDSDLREGFESVYPLGFDACVAYWETLRDQFPTSTMEVDEALMSKGRVRQ